MWTSDLTSLNPDNNSYCWLTEAYIISDHFNKFTNELNVKVLQQQISTPNPDETEYDFVNSYCLVREVYLQAGNCPWSYGRVILPHKTYESIKDQIDTLGNNLIGKTLLYGNPAITRSAFTYKRLIPTDCLYKQALQRHPQDITPKYLWARRSVFMNNDLPLVITDVYMPDLPNFN